MDQVERFHVARGAGLFEIDQRDDGIGLVAVAPHDPEETEKMPVALMLCNEGAKPLAPDQPAARLLRVGLSVEATIETKLADVVTASR